MLNKGQDQKVGDGSVALQATGNITYGATITEMRETFELLMKANFPVMRKEAEATAQATAQEFIAKMEKKIVELENRIDVSKFRDPDVQASMNDAVQASARRGAKANPDILCNLISERVSKTSSDFLDIVLSEAVHVVPKLTSKQIAMLTLVQTVVAVGVPDDSFVLTRFENLAKGAFELCSAANGISFQERSHAQYAGACSVGMFGIGMDPYGPLKQQYSMLRDKQSEEIKELFRKGAPTYLRLWEQMERDGLFNIALTSVGSAIALANLAPILEIPDLSAWIK